MSFIQPARIVFSLNLLTNSLNLKIDLLSVLVVLLQSRTIENMNYLCLESYDVGCNILHCFHNEHVGKSVSE